MKKIPIITTLYRIFYWRLVYPLRKEDWRYLISAVVGNLHGKRGYIIWSVPRSGTNLLGYMLKQHPNVTFGGEVFKLGGPYRWKRLISRGLLALSTRAVFVYKLFPNHVSRLSVSKQRAFLKYMHKKGWEIIVIRRLDTWRRVLSYAKATQGKGWSERISVKPKKSFKQKAIDKSTLKLDEVFQSFETCLKGQENMEFAIKGLPHLLIEYEKELLDSKNHQKTMNRVFEYLRVKPVPVKADRKKQSSDVLGADILNYDEIFTLVKKSKYAQHLN